MTVARTEPEKAIRELTAVLAEDPGLLVARRTRAVAYAAAGQHARRDRDLRALEKRGALTAEDAVVLGDNLRFAGRRAGGGRGRSRRTARDNPSFAQPWLSLAEVHVQASESCARPPRSLREGARPRARPHRGPARPRRHRAARGRRRRRGGALRADPGASTRRTRERSPSWVSCECGPGRADEAIALFRQAVEREPEERARRCSTWPARSPRAAARPRRCRSSSGRWPLGPRTTMALNGLGLTRLAARRPPGAAAAFRESLRLDPRPAGRRAHARRARRES